MAENKDAKVSKEEIPKMTKRRRSAMENHTVESEVKEEVRETAVEEPILEEDVTHSTTDGSHEEQENLEHISSLDMLWNHAFRELDQWAKHADFRDEVFLKEANYFADSIKRNQENMKSVREQFNKEFANWERTAREEFLMSTTALQHLFPKISYEEMNQQFDQIQSRTASILNTPIQMISNIQLMDQYLNMIDQYIAFRKNGRNQYINTIKQAASLIYESQKGFVNLFSGPIKSFMFPLNKFMEKAEDVTKS